MLDASQILTLLFVTLGPFKILGPFVQRTRDLDSAAVRGVAIRVFVLSVIAIFVSAFVGSTFLAKWNISIPAILIATGIIFFLVALRIVLSSYDSAGTEPPPPLPEDRLAAAMRLTFPTVVTPYGVAGLIAMLASAPDAAYSRLILVLALVVMVVNLGAMLVARSIMKGITVLVLQLLGAVLGVLQVALSVQILLGALRLLGVIAP